MLSVIVPVYNGAHVLPKTVPSMLAQREPAEWVFVDDGSTDGTTAVLSALVEKGAAASGATVRLLRHPTNRGRSSARNTGLEHIGGDPVVFLDADVAPQLGYLSAMQQAFRSEAVVACVGRLTYASELPSDPYQRYLRSRRRGPGDTGARAPLPWRYFLLGVGAVRAGVVREIGPLDATLSYGEDLEYASRLARRHPEGLRYVPEAVGELHDLGHLDAALAKMREFAVSNLPSLVERYPEVAARVGVEVLAEAGWRGGVSRALLRPWLARSVRRLLPILPPLMSDSAVRYLLGYTLAAGYEEGRLDRSR